MESGENIFRESVLRTFVQKFIFAFAAFVSVSCNNMVEGSWSQGLIPTELRNQPFYLHNSWFLL